MLPSGSDRSRTPTYDLEEVQRLVGQGPISRRITATAFAGADELGMEPDDIVEAILALSVGHFYKSMPSLHLPGTWQDVYHLSYRECDLYIKLQINTAGQAVVVQFKER
jgi:motility quorum-sensing regulator/GCU-specific mRNA interferase toxin